MCHIHPLGLPDLLSSPPRWGERTADTTESFPAQVLPKSWFSYSGGDPPWMKNLPVLTDLRGNGPGQPGLPGGVDTRTVSKSLGEFLPITTQDNADTLWYTH